MYISLQNATTTTIQMTAIANDGADDVLLPVCFIPLSPVNKKRS